MGDGALYLCTIFANTAGWLVTELGRYPWTVYGLFTIEDSVSPNVSVTSLLISNIIYFLLFSGLAVTMIYLVKRELNKGPGLDQMNQETDSTDPFDKGAFSHSSLQLLWFLLIGVLFSGFFFLEGFDFGVGMSVQTLAHDEHEKDQIVETIGPVWDGNEVWLLTAGGAMFASFPYWYASLFSGYYLILFIILFGLIMRGRFL